MSRYRSTRRQAVTALLALLLGAAAAPASGADAISFSGTGYDAGAVLAADGRVVVSERLATGWRRILAIDPATHVIHELTRVPPPGPGKFSMVRLTGSDGTVIATIDTYVSVAGSTDEQATPPLVASRALQVLPTLVALATRDPLRTDFPAPIVAAGGENFVALAGDDCRDRSALHVRTANGIGTIPATTGGSVTPEIMDLRAAGPFAIWTETRLDPGLTTSFVAARAATGEVLLRAPGGRGYDLAADGTVVFAQPDGCRLRVVTLAPLAQRSVPLPAGWCPNLLGDVAVAAGRAVYATGGSYAVSDLRGGLQTVADLPVETVLGGQIAFDGRTLFGVRRRCLGELLIAADTTKPGGAPAPLAPAPACVVRRAGSGRLRVAADHRVSIRLRCPHGCRVTLRLFEQRRGGRERRVGALQFSAGSTFTVRPRIARYARALAGCAGGLRVIARVYDLAGVAKSIGPYRILSRAR